MADIVIVNININIDKYYIHVYNILINVLIPGGEMTDLREMISICPVCGKPLTVRSLSCEGCESELRGRFTLPKLARLPKELQDVVEVFLRSRGNIKDVERELGISYPTVSKKLDAINLLLAEILRWIRNSWTS